MSSLESHLSGFAGQIISMAHVSMDRSWTTLDGVEPIQSGP